MAINVHVDAVTPAVVPSTGSASVVIRGQNFDPGVAVSIGGVPARAVERVDAETLVVAVPAHAIGAVDVVVSNVDGRTATATAALAYYAGALQFANHTQLVAATGHRLPLLGADFDGDGNGDMALYDLNNRLRIYAGDRAGRMVARDERSVDATTPLAAADLNRDGRDDIVAEKGVILMEAGGTLGALLPWPNAEYATHVVVLPDGAKPHMLLVEANRLTVVELQGSSLTTIATYTDAAHTVRCGSVFEPCLPAVSDFDLDGNSDLAFVDINGRARLAFGPTLGETVDLQLSPSAWGQPLALELKLLLYQGK
ncbi:MAG TPA: IPT/TIG domain-containing protein [Kofleriaceae bacterium]|nr:IPT/TIG domain-containing protein [Kofleriaceae bacterium]